MTRNEFLKTFLADWSISCIEILRKKGVDYADTADIFDNFKRHAATQGLRPEQIWAVYASKHWDAIMTFCRAGSVQSEPILDRLRDLRNYVDLLAGSLPSDHALLGDLRELRCLVDRLAAHLSEKESAKCESTC